MRVLVLHSPEKKPKKLSFPDDAEAQISPPDTATQLQVWDTVMNWGPTNQSTVFPPRFGAHLNPSEALLRSQDTDYVTQIWKAHGISTRYFEPALGRRVQVRPRYRLHIFDMRVLRVYRLGKKKYRAIRGLGKRMQYVRRMAVRCLYVLGLHFGSIDVASLSKKVAVPINFDPSPQLTSQIGKLYGTHALAYTRRLQEHADPHRPPILMGSDLEFIMKRSGGRILYASRYFSRRGRIGYDQQGSRRVRGSHPIAEIRPAPSENPDQLVAEIKSLLRRAYQRTPKSGVKWEAGSLPAPGYAVGGHIHFSRIGLTTELIRALDNYLAVPVMMLEHPTRARRRRRQYGYLGEFRWKSYGGFEYRTLSSWIVAPHIALAVLSLSKLIADNYPLLQRNFLPSVDDVSSFYRCDQSAMRSIFEAVWQDLERLDDFDKVAKDVEVIPTLVRSGKNWLESYDLRARWGLLPKPKRRTRLKRRKR